MARRVFVVAHRGASAYAPENTLPAFEEAARLGADFVETDLRATRDGVIVCIHDARVDRTTNARGFVSELTAEEIRKLDAGSWFSPLFKGVKVPLLEEFLDFLAERNVGGFLDLKQPGIELEVIGKVMRWGLEERVVVLSEYVAPLRNVKKLNPVITTQLDIPSPSPSSLRAALVCMANIVSVHSLMLDESFVELAHKRGLLVNVWGVRTPEDVLSAVEAGVDFVTADDPRMVLEAFKKAVDLR